MDDYEAWLYKRLEMYAQQRGQLVGAIEIALERKTLKEVKQVLRRVLRDTIEADTQLASELDGQAPQTRKT